MNQDLFAQGFRDFPQVNPLHASVPKDNPYALGFVAAAELAQLEERRVQLLEGVKLASGGSIGRAGFV